MKHRRPFGHIVTWSMLVVLATAAGALAANPLLPGTTLYRPGVCGSSAPCYETALPEYFTEDNVVAGPLELALKALSGQIRGTATSTVYRDPATGLLGFKYVFTSTGKDTPLRATIGGYTDPPWAGVAICCAGADGSGDSTPVTRPAGPETVTDAETSWANGDPYLIERYVTSAGEGLAFQWAKDSQGTALVADSRSSAIFVSTNAVSHRTGLATLIAGVAVSGADVFVPDEIAPPGIDVEKWTNGHDADAAPGPTIPVGGLVTWTYTVTNTSGVPLSSVTLSDDKVATTAFEGGDANGNNLLDVEETWTFEATGVATAGQYANTATVVALSGDTQVADTDPSHYFGADASIDIQKATNGEDADTPTGPVVKVGSLVTWTYVVTNTGNVLLTNVQVTDDILGAIGTISSLAPGESQTLKATGTAREGQYANIATATGTPPVGDDVMDSDPSHYFAEPDEPPAVVGIDIEKATNGEDADSPTGPVVPVGSPVTWTYVVTNTGDVSLRNVQVRDDILGSIGTIPSLAPGESQTLTAAGIAQEGQYANIATATGTPPVGDDVTDSDPSHYFGGEDPGCTYTVGYWKNHPEAWPVDELTLGGKTYSKRKLLKLLRKPPKKGNARIILIHQLIAAKLNIAAGADPDAVSDIIEEADAWLAAGRTTQGRRRAIAIRLAEVLDEYNNGIIGPGHCDDDPGAVED